MADDVTSDGGDGLGEELRSVALEAIRLAGQLPPQQLRATAISRQSDGVLMQFDGVTLPQLMHIVAEMGAIVRQRPDLHPISFSESLRLQDGIVTDGAQYVVPKPHVQQAPMGVSLLVRCNPAKTSELEALLRNLHGGRD